MLSYLVKSRALEPPRGKWRNLPSGITQFFLPSSGQENGAKPPNDPESPKVPKSQEVMAMFGMPHRAETV
jgi:hypothetical protein